eukprot:CAMPEP_0115285356 /NCGR_PEP_ID=MMETSP0270-20121206/61381_1 /TAXON_ID=71861 /ORGANISM="Scrippsiella trochoidea, Strain CCMP3099" /LENGTH=77 /DNA_ID=CAMNT_0002702361 /DNA_START=925 /DNA_END=1158 /DNA_ORIENTATION=+
MLLGSSLPIALRLNVACPLQVRDIMGDDPRSPSRSELEVLARAVFDIDLRARSCKACNAQASVDDISSTTLSHKSSC